MFIFVQMSKAGDDDSTGLMLDCLMRNFISGCANILAFPKNLGGSLGWKKN